MVKTTLKIDGMMCGMCESHVNDAIRNAFPVKKVTSSHSKGETVIISEEALSADKIREVMQPTGYELKDITSLREKGLILKKVSRKNKDYVPQHLTAAHFLYVFYTKKRKTLAYCKEMHYNINDSAKAHTKTERI